MSDEKLKAAENEFLEWLEECELFDKTKDRLNSEEWEEIPEGMSLMEWADIHPKK